MSTAEFYTFTAPNVSRAQHKTKEMLSNYEATEHVFLNILHLCIYRKGLGISGVVIQCMDLEIKRLIS